MLCKSVTEISAGAMNYPLTGACFWNILCVISYYIKKITKSNTCAATGLVLMGNLNLNLK